jgi:hypothetical protein
MQTAAGVAAGALAFQGIESLMHGFGHTAGYGSSFGGFDSDRPEIINNYYGDAAEHGPESHLSPDIEDRRGESRFSEAVDNNDHGDNLMDGGNFDNTDDSNFDDSADFSDSFDSGGDDSSF